MPSIHTKMTTTTTTTTSPLPPSRSYSPSQHLTYSEWISFKEANGDVSFYYTQTDLRDVVMYVHNGPREYKICARDGRTSHLASNENVIVTKNRGIIERLPKLEKNLAIVNRWISLLPQFPGWKHFVFDDVIVWIRLEFVVAIVLKHIERNEEFNHQISFQMKEGVGNYSFFISKESYQKLSFELGTYLND